MRRLLAALAAVAMVVGALGYRAGRDGDVRSAGGTDVLLCAAELQPACDDVADGGVDVVVERAADTADRLATQVRPDTVVWLAPAMWPAMVDDARRRAGLPVLLPRTVVVARSPLAALTGATRPDCGWRCIGDGAGDGTLHVGVPPPAGSTVGLAATGALAAAWFGSADVAANDFDPAFLSWLATAVGGARTDDEPMARILQSRAFFDVAIGTEATAEQLLQTADRSRSEGLQLLYPEPMVTVDVALAAGGSVSRDIARRSAAALAAAGWRTANLVADPELPQTSGLPRAGVLVALRQQVRR